MNILSTTSAPHSLPTLHECETENTSHQVEVQSDWQKTVERLTRSISETSFYMRAEYGRGVFDYGINFPNSALWIELLNIGGKGKILDAGCGNAVFVQDLYSSRINLEKEFTLATARIRYRPGKAPQDGFSWRHEMSQRDFEENKELLDGFTQCLETLRNNPPKYVGITADGLSEKQVEINKEVFSTQRVYIIAGKFFNELSQDEILQDGKKFDIAMSIFGVLTYSKTLKEDAYKLLCMLKVNGKLFIKSDPDSYYVDLYNGTKKIIPVERVFLNKQGKLKSLANWFELGEGIKVISSFSGSGVSLIVIEKIAEQVILRELDTADHFVEGKFKHKIPCHTFDSEPENI